MADSPQTHSEGEAGQVQPTPSLLPASIQQFDMQQFIVSAKTHWNHFQESEHVQNTKQVFLSYGELLSRSAPLRLLWLASIVSQIGDWFNEIALLTLLHVLLPNSGILLSFLLITRELPPFLLGPVVGIVADKYDKRWVMIVSDLARAVTVLMFLFVRSHWIASLLYVLSFLQFSISAFFTPAKAALIPAYVNSRDLVTANTLDGFSYSAVLFLASAAGAFFTALAGYYANFLVDSISYIISAFLTYQLFAYPYSETTSSESCSDTAPMLPMEKGVQSQAGSVPRGDLELSPIGNDDPSSSSAHQNLIEPVSSRNVTSSGAATGNTSNTGNGTGITTQEMMQRLHEMESQMRNETAEIEAKSKVNLAKWWILIQEGFEYLKSEKYIFVIANAKAAGSLIWGGQELLNIRFANTDFVWGPNGTISLGIVYAVVGLSVGLGPFLLQVKYADTPRNNERCLLLGFVMLCIGSVLLPMSPNLVLLLLFNIIRAMGSGSVWVFSSSILMRCVRPSVRGRVFAYENGLQTFLSVSSKLGIGILLDVFKMSTATCASFPAAASIFVCLLAVYLYYYREQENIDYAPVTDDQHSASVHRQEEIRAVVTGNNESVSHQLAVSHNVATQSSPAHHHEGDPEETISLN